MAEGGWVLWGLAAVSSWGWGWGVQRGQLAELKRRQRIGRVMVPAAKLEMLLWGALWEEGK